MHKLDSRRIGTCLTCISAQSSPCVTVLNYGRSRSNFYNTALFLSTNYLRKPFADCHFCQSDCTTCIDEGHIYTAKKLGSTASGNCRVLGHQPKHMVEPQLVSSGQFPLLQQTTHLSVASQIRNVTFCALQTKLLTDCLIYICLSPAACENELRYVTKSEYQLKAWTF